MMQSQYAQLKLTFWSVDGWKSQKQILELLSLLRNQPEDLRPSMYGQHAQALSQIDWDHLDDILNLWAQTPIGLSLYMQAQNSQDLWITLESYKFKRLVIGIQDKFFNANDNIEKFKLLSTQLFTLGQGCYGYVCHQNEFEKKNVMDKPVMIGGQWIKTGGTRVDVALPGIYWSNYFGPPYIDWFGKQKLNSVPCLERIWIDEERVFIRTAQSPLQYADPNVTKIEKNIVTVLGDDRFFNIKNPTANTYAPEFNLDV